MTGRSSPVARGCGTMNLFSPRRRTNHCPVTIRSTVIIHERGESDDARLPRFPPRSSPIHAFKKNLPVTISRVIVISCLGFVARPIISSRFDFIYACMYVCIKLDILSLRNRANRVKVKFKSAQLGGIN